MVQLKAKKISQLFLQTKLDWWYIYIEKFTEIVEGIRRQHNDHTVWIGDFNLGYTHLGYTHFSALLLQNKAFPVNTQLGVGPILDSDDWCSNKERKNPRSIFDNTSNISKQGNNTTTTHNSDRPQYRVCRCRYSQTLPQWYINTKRWIGKPWAKTWRTSVSQKAIRNINDMPEHVNSKCRLFVDDSIIYREVKSNADLINSSKTPIAYSKTLGNRLGDVFQPLKVPHNVCHQKTEPHTQRLYHQRATHEYCWQSHIPRGKAIIRHQLEQTNGKKVATKANWTLGFIRRTVTLRPKH